ncbi:MAG: energy-coupling factor ABC transporter ATP-binding protein [Bacillota bacterium]
MLNREKSPHHLSFGQKKRVAIAGVLAMDPEVMILDEPTAYLDPQGQDLLFDILQEFHRRGKTLLVATHDMDLAAEWADHVISQGRPDHGRGRAGTADRCRPDGCGQPPAAGCGPDFSPAGGNSALGGRRGYPPHH